MCIFENDTVKMQENYFNTDCWFTLLVYLFVLEIFLKKSSENEKKKSTGHFLYLMLLRYSEWPEFYVNKDMFCSVLRWISRFSRTMFLDIFSLSENLGSCKRLAGPKEQGDLTFAHVSNNLGSCKRLAGPKKQGDLTFAHVSNNLGSCKRLAGPKEQGDLTFAHVSNNLDQIFFIS